MNRILSITAKDVRLLFQDAHAAILLLALPVVFIAVIGFSTGRVLGWQADNQVVRVGVVDLDGSPLSEEIVARFRERPEVRVTNFIGTRESSAAFDSREIDVVVVVGREFSARVAELKPADVLDTTVGPLTNGLHTLDVEVEARTSLRNTGSVVDGLLFGEVLRGAAAHVARNNRLTAWFLRNRDPGSAEESGPLPSRVSERDGEAMPSLYQQVVPAYVVLFAFFLVTIMARSFLAERELGTLARMQIAPVSHAQILAGKTLPFVLLSLTQCTLLLVIGWSLFGMQLGRSPWLLAPIVVATSVCAASLGLLVACTVRTDAQVSAYATSLILVMGGLSGCMVPREFLPPTLLSISLVTPHAWALEAYHAVLVTDDPNTGLVLRCCAAMLGFTALFAVLGVIRFRQLLRTV